MLLREKLDEHGKWLFRWRSYLPLPLVALFFFAMYQYGYYRYYGYQSSSEVFNAWEMVCLAVSLFGVGIRVITVGYSPKGTSGRNKSKQIADELNTSSIYSVVRNPLYLGNFFVGLGVAGFPYIWWLVLVYAFLFWVYYERIIFTEEKYLSDKFGKNYLRWAESTPIFIPSFRKYKSTKLNFSLRVVIGKESGCVIAIISIMLAMVFFKDYLASDSLVINLGWAYIFWISFFLWIIVRILKKCTTIFSSKNK